MSGKHRTTAASGEKTTPDAIVIETPTKVDGADLWRIATDSQKLDVNSSYAYVLWCQDFSDTSVVARLNGAAVGFIIGYRKQRDPETALVWQVAVDDVARGRGLAGGMLDTLYTRLYADGVRYLETTITPDNQASIALFSSFAKRWSATLERSELFVEGDFPEEHEPEDLYRIGPLVPPG